MSDSRNQEIQNICKALQSLWIYCPHKTLGDLIEMLAWKATYRAKTVTEYKKMMREIPDSQMLETILDNYYEASSD